MSGLPAPEQAISSVGGTGIRGAEVTYHFLVDATSGVAIQAGINVTVAAAGCSTFPVIATVMEALP